MCTGRISNRGNCNLLKFTSLISVTIDSYSTPHIFEFLQDVQNRFEKNPVGADNQFDFVLGHLKKTNKEVIDYIVATHKPRSMMELEDVIVMHYGQPKKLERMYKGQLQLIGRCPWPVLANNANSIYNLLNKI